MIPIHELLNRIRWDREYGQADIEIGYYDRLEQRIIRVPMRSIFFEPGDHFAFDLYDHEGELHSIPLHRVKQVFRNGELIWQREH
ncbi:MAG: DUF504 domain-containing protein [Gammaproteobacteria bacterium]|jgi:uncharacterized protein (UPF0248 family)|nr:DUF504 domain-containing protein [Gammaproteobacteria bacterium]